MIYIFFFLLYLLLLMCHRCCIVCNSSLHIDHITIIVHLHWDLPNSTRQNGLFSDRYIYCEKCFQEIQGDEVELSDDPTQPVT